MIERRSGRQKEISGLSVSGKQIDWDQQEDNYAEKEKKRQSDSQAEKHWLIKRKSRNTMRHKNRKHERETDIEISSDWKSQINRKLDRQTDKQKMREKE